MPRDSLSQEFAIVTPHKPNILKRFEIPRTGTFETSGFQLLELFEDFDSNRIELGLGYVIRSYNRYWLKWPILACIQPVDLSRYLGHQY
jgi:hypothetical protein